MTDNFFSEDKPEVPEAPKEVEPIKIGEKEYTQEELAYKVGLGETAAELEAKWNTKIDKLYPEYTKKTQRLSELEEQIKKQSEEEAVKSKQTRGEELTPEEVRAQALKQAEELGIVTKAGLDAYFDQKYAERRSAEKLIDGVETLLDEAKQVGKPIATIEKVLEHMQTTGIRIPEKAYKDMFEPELKKWEEDQLNKIRQPGLVTQDRSTAGGKQPEQVRPTRDNLEELLKQRLGQ